MRFHLIWLTSVALAAGLASASAQTLSFTPSTHAFVTGARGAVGFDVNRDGWMDVASANTGRNTVSILINNGASGAFRAPREIPVGRGPFDIAAGDLDRDGVPDLAVAVPDQPSIEVLLMRADGTLKSRTVVSSVESRGLTIADLNRDGALDIVVADYALNRIVALRGNGRGGFLTPLTWTLGIRPQGVAVEDFNHDGFQDIAVANTTGSVLTVLYGTATTAVSPRSFAAGRTHNVLVAADVNLDGWMDIAAVSTDTNVVSFFRGGSSGFTLAGTRATGASPRDVTMGDFNSDGRPDFAVGNFSSNSVTVLLGRRDTTALADRWGDLPAGANARSLVAGDFNHDGRLDFVATA
jgi:VCBS repeat protein